MWDKSNKDVPIKERGVSQKQNRKVGIHQPQDFSDGLLEFLSFETKVKFGVMERLFTGGGKRITQGKHFSDF